MSEIKGLTKKIKLAIAIIIAVIVLTIVAVIVNVNNPTIKAEFMEAERLLATRKSINEETGEDIDFKVFFLRDTDGDGYAEEMKEVYKQLGSNETLFVDLNIKTQGYLKNGEITLESGGNFKWRTTLVNSNIIKGDYIGETNNIKLQDNLANGTQLLLYGTVLNNVGNNIYNYNKTSTMKLTGTFVDEDGNETPIEKVQKVTMNWYGETKTAIQSTSQSYNIDKAISGENFNANFNVVVAETKGELLLQKQEAVVTIPEANGYKPTSVVVNNSNVTSNYDEETGILTISREADVDIDGNIIKSVARSNLYNITVKYPIEAFTESGKETLEIEIPITGTNYGFNNDEYINPHITSDITTIKVNYYKNNSEVVVVKPIFNLYTYVGTYARTDYRVSKNGPINLYNGNVNDEKDQYPVVWQAYVGDYRKIKTLTLEEKNGDKFNNNDSMYEYVTTTGVYFSDPTSLLGNSGKIELYNAEDGTLIKTFKKDTWNNYTSLNPFKTNVKSIKIVTSKPIDSGSLYVYQVKEIDDEKLTNKGDNIGYTLEEFESLKRIYTYLQGTASAPSNVIYDNDETTLIKSTYNSALYDMPYSVVDLNTSLSEITNQKVNNMDFIINTSTANSFERIWKNGVFVIELPENIINVDIKNVNVSNADVEIVSSIAYEEDGKRFIRIDTKNDNELVYKITLNVDVYGNPLLGDSTEKIRLYAFNKYCDNYFNKTLDIYDIDGDLSTTDNVGYSEKTIKIRAPQGIITTEYVSDYDENNSITIAPNIAEIERADEKRKATINVSISNNYANIINEIKILGKIPFEGNTYVLNGQNQELGSEYTACIDSEIRMPEELKEYVTVYYTDVEKPTVDLADSSNNWSTEVTDWSKVKNYLIDLGDYVLTRNANEIFSYDVYVPEKLGYNSASYSAHAVYYSLQTDEAGKYQTSTQPNKVGIQVVGKYNLEVVKNKANQDNIFVAGATYSLTTKVDDKDVSQIATTDENGKLIFKKVYIGREYTLKEISSPENYELNEKEIKFKTKLDDTGENLIVEQVENSFSSDPVVTIDENGNYYVKSTVEDESKITLKINTINTEGEKIKNVKYDITKDSKITTYTNELKDIEIPDYSVDKEAKLKQTKADGYYLKQGEWPFTFVRDEETHKLKIVTEDDEIRNAVIEEDIDGQTIVTITIVNEKIPTYDLKIVKIEEVKNSEDEVELLKGAQFRLYSYDLEENQFVSIEDKNGVTIDDLYQYVEGKYISGRYILQEIEAPGGYCNNTEEIIFSVEKNEEEELSLKIENQDNLISIYNYEIVDNTVKLYIQDKPLFRLEKRDSATGELLSNAKFVIYELDDDLNEVDFAKDINGNYVGIQDENGDYIVTTNEVGEIILPLRAGLYLIKEVSYPEGYQENDVKNIFRIAGADDIGTAEMDDEDSEIKIQYIEDLVELSNNVNSGKKYSNKNIVLERDLDFNDPSSYRSNVVDQTLITGEGFTPIGKDANNYFDGTFDGNNHKIENLYQNIEDTSIQYSGIFGYISKAEIYNLDISGDINVNSQNKAIGSIAGYANESKISNCNSTCTINDLNGAINNVGGIVGDSKTTIISYCTNGRDITKNNIKGSVSVGGIAGQKNSQETLYCSNMGNITCTFEDKDSSTATYEASVGGLAGINTGEAKNSYNTGNITINNNNQITKYTENVGGLFGKSYGSINESYNLGNITNQINDAQKNVGYEGGLVGYYSGHNSTLSNENAIVKCYNIGTIKGTNYVGGLIGNYISSVMYTKSAIKDSYNIGDISGNYSGGIVGIVRYGRSVHYKLTNCYNSSRITGTYAGEILGNVEIRNSGTNQWITSTTIENCYYLENSIDSENITSKGTVMSEEQMKDIEFVNTLNNTSEVWKSDSANINNGYPVLDITESSAEEQYITGTVEINYIEDLVELANNVNKGISYKSANVILMRNLDFNDADSYRSNEVDQSLISGTGFKPIGYSALYAFNGIFDGNGKTIKNLYIMNPPFTYGLILHIGLFGYTNNAKIENLNLEDVNLSGSAPTSSNYKSYVGALVSYAVDTAIKNCSTSGTVKTGNGRAGIVNNGTRTTIEDCVNNVNFIGGGDSYTAGTYPVGGICYSLTNGTIKRCANKGHVDSGTTAFSGGILYSGSNSDIYYCYNTGEVNGVGIVYSASKCRIAGCYNTGEVKLAGIAGSISGISSIYKCYNSGNVSSAGSIAHVGGIVRYINNTGTVSNCYNTGNIINTYANASYSGGIVGYVNGTATVKNCYNSGNINDATSNSYAGGIIGYSNKSTITDCYNTGTIEINSTYNVAGIIGNSSRNDTITNTYNIGSIVIDSQSRSSIGGGINAINVANEIQNSYYLKDSIKTIEYPSSKDGIPLESSEMITKDFYDTLNVNNVWKYNKNNYPTLKNMDLILGDIPEVTELSVENTIKKFNITTEIINEDGGTVDAQSEIVEYGKNNVEDYVITANDGYEILSITINGKELVLSDDDKTLYTIPKDYFTNVIEDKHIVITFSASDEIFELNKVDKNDLSKKLEGAKYIITSDPRQDDIELGEPVNDCTQYKKKNDDKKVEGVIGSMQQTETAYTFVQNSDGSISSNNQGKSGNNNIACVCYEVDLTGKEGTYFINLDYDVSAYYYYSESDDEYTYYAYGFAMVTTEPRTNNKTVPTASQRFLYAVKNTNSTAYSAYLEGGQKYYLYIGYRGYSVRNNFTDTLTVRNINVYESTTYEFEKVDDKYISSNQGIDSANSSICFPIDLREKNGKYDLTVNAEISSQSNGDYGYVIVNQSPNSVTSSTTSGRFIYISGEKPAEDYTTVLDGGNLYYLHFGYSKNTSNSSGTDTFTINDINVSLNRTGYIYEELTTDENGKIKLEVSGDTELYIQEIEAPSEYILDENIYSYKMIPGESNNSLTLTNSSRPKLIVHHYYEGTNNKVADDEVYIGNIGEEYSVAPNLDLDKLKLVTDQNGNYILPDKMNGIYDEKDIEVTFYYKLEPVRLTIHHYFEGTENRLVEDEIIETQANITFREDSLYTVFTEATYELKTNTNYNRLIKENDFIGVNSTIGSDITIEDTLEYFKDEEITYYYKLREYQYTVNYIYDGVKDDDATITDVALYNNTIESYIEKDKLGYKFYTAKALDENGEETELPLTIKEDVAKNIINVYYVPDETLTKDLMYTVEYYKNGEKADAQTETVSVQVLEPDIVTVDKTKINTTNKYLGYKFDEETTGTIPDTVESGSVIKVYYVVDPDSSKELNYTVEYYKEGVKVDEDTQIKTAMVQLLEPDTIEVDATDINTADKYVGYTLDTARTGTIPAEVQSGEVIKIYYVKSDFEYQVQYYYENELDESKTETRTAKFESEITTYPTEGKDKTGFSFERTENLPLTISADVTKNIIKVYYETEKTTYTVKKEWNVPESQANKYRATFNLKRKSDNEIVKDSQENNLEVIIRGNGTETFTNLPAYDLSGKIEYEVVEVKVEKTEDNGTTWKEVDSSNVTTEYQFGTKLADVVEVGDYVNYVPTTGSYTVAKADTGTQSDQTFTTNTSVRWRVLSVDKANGKVTLMAEEPISDKTLNLWGKAGYINYTNILNNISALYGNGAGAQSARSMTLADVEQYSRYDKTTYTHSWQNKKIGDTRTYNEGTFINENGVDEGVTPFTATQTQYRYEGENYFDSSIYNMLFKKAENTRENKEPYFLATRGTSLWSVEVNYGLYAISNGWLESGPNGKTSANSELYLSGSRANSTNKSAYAYVMPVVELQANIATNGKDENNVWLLEKDGEEGNNSTTNVIDMNVTNSIVKNYKVKNEFNVSNTDDYKSTFTLYKSVNGSTPVVVTDEQNNPVTKVVTGNGTVTFEGLEVYDGENEIVYTVEETKVEKTDDNGENWTDVTNQIKVVHDRTSEEFDDVVTNSLANRFGLEINQTESEENKPLKDVEYKISIKDQDENELVDQTKTYKTGEDGKLGEIIADLIIGSADKKYTVTITEESTPDRYKTKDPITFEVEAKLSSDGVTFELKPETKTLGGENNVVITNNLITINAQNEVKDNLSYTVKYLEKDTDAEVADEKTVDNKTIGEEVTETAIDVDGYNKDGETTKTIEITTGTNEIIFYYTKKNDLSYKVKYLEKDTGTELAESKTVDNKTFKETVEETAANVEGYNVDGESTKTIEIGIGTNEIIFYYTKKNDLSYTVNYLEKDTENVIHQAKEVNTATYEKVVTAESEKIDIEGYNFDSSDKASITIGIDAAENVINLYYTKKTDLSYTVNYLEKDTENVIHEAKEVNTATYEEVITAESEKIKIPGYKYDSSDKTSITIGIDANENVLNLYYTMRTDLSYTVNYLEKGTTTAIHEAKEVEGHRLGDVITTSIEKIDIDGYNYDSMDKETLTIGAEENVINIYYTKAKFAYTVHYFYDGVEDIAKLETLEAEFKSEISTYPTEGKSEGEKVFIKAQALGEDGNEKDLPLTIGTDVSKNVINVYYRTANKVITEVSDHTEKYKNGTTKTAKGGTISEYNEGVLNGDDITKPIVIKPNSGYEIAKVIIKTANGTDELDVNSYKAEDGSITLTKNSHAYLRNITSNVEITAEFVRKTSVTVKYLEKDTKKKLAEPVTIKGVEGQLVNAKRAEVTDYREAQVTTTDSSKSTVTYENMDKFVETTGMMFADATTIVYWYEKIPEGTIVVKHIEIDEKDIRNGLTLTSGKEISTESYKGKVETAKDTSRKEIKDNVTGRKYISVNGPTSKDESIIIVGKDKNSYTAKYKEIDKNNDGKMDVVEVRYYYEKQYDITIDVKEHIENVNGTDIKVKGGTVVAKEGTSQTNTKIVENVNNRATNTKEIVITPDKNYMIKAVYVNEKAMDISNLINKNGVVIIGKGYFEEITEDKNITAEFEKIQTKVIVRYIDIDTAKELKQEVTIVGKIEDSYKVERVTITGYETAGKEPKNAEGTRTLEDIIVTYYYKKVEEKHAEDNKEEKPEEKSTDDKKEEKPIDVKEDVKDTTDTKTQEPTTHVKPANPYTGDNIKNFVGSFIVSAIGLIVINLSKRTRKTKKY